MPYVQPLPWTEFLTCPICTHSFGYYRRHPISLGCGHSVCRLCLASLYNQQCPFDQSPITVDHKNLPVNSALLRLASLRNGEENELLEIFNDIPPPSVRDFLKDDLRCFFVAKACIENLALHLRDAIGNAESALSRSMQRKLVTLINCQLMTEEGRSRAIRVCRCIGERTVIEMIMRQQKPMQLNSCLWAAVRGRGCQFLGPVLQEDVLRHLLGALAGGAALSRKSLVMQVVTSLKSEYSQASKTSVGHVVQLLYRASCFNVSKRECESSLMQLKEEFSTYDSLRQEHDAQIVQIAMEAGLRIPPEQWSNLLYGDQQHKSYMQSIIDRLQTTESFKQSIQELHITVARNGDMHEFENMRPHLQELANIESAVERATPTTWTDVGKVLTAMKNVIKGFVDFELRLRKQAEDQRRLSHRNFNSILSQSRSDLDSYRSDSLGIIETEPPSLRLSRPAMRPSQPSSSNGRPLLTHPPHRTNGASIPHIDPTKDPRQRFEVPQQTSSQPAYRLMARPGQRNAYMRSSNGNGIAPNPNRQKYSFDTNGTSVVTAPPPGFEPLLLSSCNAVANMNMINSPCSSSSTYNSSSSNGSDSNAACRSNFQRSNGLHTHLLQPNWMERRSNALDLQPRHQQSQHRISYQQQQQYHQNQQHQQQQQQCTKSNDISGDKICDSVSENASGSIDTASDQETRDRRQMEALQERFNQALNSASFSRKSEHKGFLVKDNAHDGQDAGVDTATVNRNGTSLNNQTETRKKINMNKSQQALHDAFFNSKLNLKAKCFSLSNDKKISLSTNTSSFDYNSPFDTAEKDQQEHDKEEGEGSDCPAEKPGCDMVFPKSETIDLTLPNISREKLREIWQVPPEKPEAKTIEEIWQPLQLKLPSARSGHEQLQQQQHDEHFSLSRTTQLQTATPSLPTSVTQLSERKSLEEIFRRHNQEQNQNELHLQQQRHEKAPITAIANDYQSNFATGQGGDYAAAAGYSRGSSDNTCVRGNLCNPPTYQDWLTRRNYVCMEAAYSKIADRYPNVGVGPWTQTQSHNHQHQAGHQLGCNNAALYRNNVQHTTTQVYTSTPLRPFPTAPEPSNLGLSALRLLGHFDEGFNPEVSFTPCPPSPRPPARKSALDAAIDTYWKDAMEASLGLNMFLPPAAAVAATASNSNECSFNDRSYTITENLSPAPSMRFGLEVHDELKQHCSSAESTTTPTDPQ